MDLIAESKKFVHSLLMIILTIILILYLIVFLMALELFVVVKYFKAVARQALTGS